MEFKLPGVQDGYYQLSVTYNGKRVSITMPVRENRIDTNQWRIDEVKNINICALSRLSRGLARTKETHAPVVLHVIFTCPEPFHNKHASYTFKSCVMPAHADYQKYAWRHIVVTFEDQVPLLALTGTLLKTEIPYYSAGKHSCTGLQRAFFISPEATGD